MTDLLSDLDVSQKIKRPTFSKIAFCIAAITFALLAILLINAGLMAGGSGGNPKIMRPISGLMLFSMIMGLTFSIISLIRKEKIRYLRTIAATINIGLALIIFGLMLFSLFMDLKKMSN